MLSIVGAILAIGFLIIVHEAGHYFVARWCNMRVDRFSIGFGPPILSWRRGETDFTIGPIPFGGFVQINGMTLVDDIDPEDPRQYPNRPVWQRFAAIFAGPATNYLAAIVLAIGLYAVAGVPSGTSWYAVGGYMDEDAKALQADGLKLYDQILAINGEPLYFTYEGKEPAKALSDYVTEAQGAPLAFTVLRDGKEIEVVTRAAQRTEQNSETKQDEQIWRLGIKLAPIYERVDEGFLASVGHGLVYPLRQTKLIAVGLYEIITGQQEGELAGPVGIASVTKKAIEAGWISLVLLLMALNVYLGLFNLLPLPALDGGRLAFLLYEMTTRRRANPKVEATVHMVGIMTLLLVMVLVTYKDIRKLF